MAIKLYPPQLEGTLPAFYKTYGKLDNSVNNEIDYSDCQGATIIIPFGMNRAVSTTEIKGIHCRIRTIATNTYLINKETDIIDYTQNICYLKLTTEEAEKFYEGQYYKVQIAFTNHNDTPGYYSTVGIIKCVAKPTVTIANFDEWQTNQFNDNYQFVGLYQQDTHWGDSTEKVYSYSFILLDDRGEVIDQVVDQLHDATADIASDESNDTFITNKVIADGVVASIVYKVVTMNGLEISSPTYQVMKSISVDIENPLKLIATTNYDNGYIDLSFEGAVGADNSGSVHELVYSGTFVISRCVVYKEKGDYGYNPEEKYEEWEEIARFIIKAGYPSDYKFRDYTVQQGVKYRYAVQQYNIKGVQSNKIKSLNRRLDDPYHLYNEPTLADFEDMFLYDGHRQLKIRFNPKVDSFKNSIPEQKIETIGSKYPFIFRNGKVCYKEFPIAGLISFQMDEAVLFLDKKELEESHILQHEQFRTQTNTYEESSYKIWGHEQNYEWNTHTQVLYDSLTGQPLKDKQGNILTKEISTFDPRQSEDRIVGIVQDTSSSYNVSPEETGHSYEDWTIRFNKDLTTQNMMSERYFKLKVLDWLTDGKVKLFRSPGEGNYLVRLLNVSMKPKDPLGRMLHDFTCTGYEIDELNYNNLIYYGIVNNHIPTVLETHWGSIDLKPLIENWKDNGKEGWIEIPTGETSIENFSLYDFVPGDQVRVHFADDVEDKSVTFTIGVTGTFNYAYDDRVISSIEILPVDEPYPDFGRTIVYQYPGILLTKFDTIASIKTHTQIAEEFVGPKEDLLNPYNLLELNEHEGESFDILYNNIKNKDNINYALGAADKFRMVNVDILKVRKRLVIPIYACEDLDSNLDPYEKTKYRVTPFGIGYVNNRIITEPGIIYDSTEVEGQEEPIITERENFKQIEVVDVVPTGGINGGINALDIQEVTKYLKDQNLFAVYQNPPLPLIDAFTILKVYVPREEDGQYVWQPCEKDNYIYYDTYYGKWWPAGLEYDPTFSINSVDKEHKIGKANKYTDANGWDPGWASDSTQALTRISQMPIYVEDQIKHAYDWYELIETPDDDETNKINVNEIEEITLYNLGQIEKLTLGSGVMAEVTARMQVIDYLVEDTNADVATAKANYKGKNNLNEDIGVYAEFQKALTNYMTKADEIQAAKLTYYELEEIIAHCQEEYTKYDEARTGLPKFLDTVNGLINSLYYKLYYIIQGQPNVTIDDISGSIFDVMDTNLTNLINKAEDPTDWVEVPLDDYEVQGYEITWVKDDSIRLTFRDTEEKQEIICERTGDTFYQIEDNPPIVMIEFKMSENQPNNVRKISVTHYIKRIGQIANILRTESYPTGATTSVQFWPSTGVYLTEGSVEEGNLKIYRYVYDTTDSESKIIESVTSGQPMVTEEKGRYSNRSVEYEELPEIAIIDAEEGTYNLTDENIKQQIMDLVDSICSDEIFLYVLDLYRKFLDKSQSAVSRTNGIIDILTNNPELKNDDGIVIYEKYLDWLIRQIVKEPETQFKDTTYAINDEGEMIQYDQVQYTLYGRIGQIYKLLHFYNILPEDMIMDTPLTQNEYSKLFFLGTQIQNYDWMIYIVEDILNIENLSIEEILYLISSEGITNLSQYGNYLRNVSNGYSVLTNDTYDEEQRYYIPVMSIDEGHEDEIIGFDLIGNLDDYLDPIIDQETEEIIGYKFKADKYSEVYTRKEFVDIIEPIYSKVTTIKDPQKFNKFVAILNRIFIFGDEVEGGESETITIGNIYLGDIINEINEQSIEYTTKHYYQGDIVDAYDIVLAHESEYLKIKRNWFTYSQWYEENFPSNIDEETGEYLGGGTGEWSKLQEELDALILKLNKFQDKLENKDLIQETTDEDFMDAGQYADLDTYLRTEILKLQSQIIQKEDELNNYVIEGVTQQGEDTTFTYNDWIYYREKLETIKSEVDNIIVDYSEKAHDYNSLVYNYIKLIIYAVELDSPYREDMSLVEMLNAYWFIINNVQKQPSDQYLDYQDQVLEITNYQAIQAYNVTYRRFKDYIDQLEFHRDTYMTEPTSTVDKIAKKINEFVDSYLKTLELFNYYTEEMNRVEEEEVKAMEQKRKLEGLINTDIPENFDNAKWMEMIEQALTRYLLALSKAYQVEVEARYNT